MKKSFLFNAIILFLMVNLCIGQEAQEKKKPGMPLPGKGKITAEEIIKKLDLKPLETKCGDFYKEIYRSPVMAKTDQPHSSATLIYNLFSAKTITPWYKIAQDEIVTYYAGSPLRIVMINEAGKLEEKMAGKNVNMGEEIQVIIPAGRWRCMTIKDNGEASWGLYGEWSVPGFDPKDITIGNQEELAKQYPFLNDKTKELQRAKNQ